MIVKIIATPLHMVSAWACNNRLVLDQEATDEKSNEITAIPKLLALVSLPELWQEFVAQTTENPVGLRREGFAEYECVSDELLSRKAEHAKKAHEAALVDIFKELKTKDPEVAAAALDVWDDVAALPLNFLLRRQRF